MENTHDLLVGTLSIGIPSNNNNNYNSDNNKTILFLYLYPYSAHILSSQLSFP